MKYKNHKLDLIEWDIKTTSNNCPHVNLVFVAVAMEVVQIECNHPDIAICLCSPKNCPEIINEEKMHMK